MYDQLKSVLYSDESVDGNHQLSIGANIIAATGVVATTTIASNPLWVVKTRFQTQGMRVGIVPYRSTLSSLRGIANEKGIRGLYRANVAVRRELHTPASDCSCIHLEFDIFGTGLVRSRDCWLYDLGVLQGEEIIGGLRASLGGFAD